MTWIDSAADDIAGEGLNYYAICEVITKHAAPLVTLLRESRREHLREEVCDRAVYGDGQPADGTCTCGADAWNARIDAVLNA